MKKMKAWTALLLIVAFAAITALPAAAEDRMPAALEELDVSDYFSKRDFNGEWSEKKAVAIEWAQGEAVCDGAGAAVSGEDVIISESGVYVLSGEAQNATVTVNASSEDKVQLVLNGIHITSVNSAAILVENADKVFITLAEGTENELANGGAFDAGSDVDAVIFSRDDLSFNGAGRLTLRSPAGHGIVGKDDVKIASGTYVISAGSRGIDANDSLRIADGDFTIVSGKDALRAKHDEESKGWVLVLDGTFDLTVGGGAQNVPAHTENWGSRGQSSAADTESRKGVKSSGNLLILGGEWRVDSADDALHSNADLWINHGAFLITTGDDALHADQALMISGGSIDIQSSYEGLEAQNIRVSGGSVSLVASDDGLNAAGGKDASGYGWNDMFASDGVSSVEISGGEVHVNARGDGVDSNGDLFISGGRLVVSGPTNSGNGALDYNGTAVITGGTVVAAGAQGMAQSFGRDSTQPFFLVNLSGNAGSEIRLTDSNGQVILSATVEKMFQCVVISCPDLQIGEAYTVSSDVSSVTVTVSSVGNGAGDGFGGSGGGPGGWGGSGGNHGGGQR